MAQNVLNVSGEILAIASGSVVLLIFAIVFSPLVHRVRTLPGSATQEAGAEQHREHEEEGEAKRGEVVRADGYIDSFAGVIQESGGGLPLLMKITLIGVLVWWVAYLILNWSQWLVSIRTFG